MKILITGAHLTPALAMIDYIQAEHPKDEIFFVGRVYSQEKLKQKSVEKEEVAKRGIKFIPFEAVKFRGNNFFTSIFKILSFPKTVSQAKEILIQEKIEVFLSFGSYLAVPFALAAKALKIPVITHEQTVSLGKANQFIAQIADVVALSYKSTAKYLRNKNYFLTGNPVRRQIFAEKLPRPTWLKKEAKKIILIMGGNQGSFVINQLIKNLASTLLDEYTLVHQCGRANVLRNFPSELKKMAEKLVPKQKQNYYVKEWISENDLFWLYRHATFAISRAGANAVQEMCISQLPALLIPLPHNYNDEQEKNAQMMSQLGGAIIVEQKNLREELLLEMIAVMNKESQRMRQQLKENYHYQDATVKLYQLLANYKKIG